TKSSSGVPPACLKERLKTSRWTRLCLQILNPSSLWPGLVAIRGVRSGLFLCMSRDGWAHGAEKFSDDCIFKENLEENHYTTYSSYSHPGNYLALSRKGELRRGGSANRNQASTHFLPRRRLW
uniref:Fibroblast growth factor n=1 Tax=Oryzias latipes TaxID=8090 RepID=A0A3P9LW86_ORYLA